MRWGIPKLYLESDGNPLGYITEVADGYLAETLDLRALSYAKIIEQAAQRLEQHKRFNLDSVMKEVYARCEVCCSNTSLYLMEECYSCTYWQGKIKQVTNWGELLQIIGGKLFYLAPEESPFVSTISLDFRGFNGLEFTMRTLKGDVIRTTNLWYQGVIPSGYRADLPDTAMWS